MRILSIHPRSWNGDYSMLCQLRSMGHEVSALEEKRDLPQGARWFADFYMNPGDGIATFWYDPRRGSEKLLTWPMDRLFRRAFDGRNLVHRMWIIHKAVKHFRPDVVFCSDGFSYALPAAFLKRMGLLPMRLVVSYIGGDVLDCPQAAVGKRRTWLTDRLIKASLPAPEALRPVSPLLEFILLRDGADKARIHVIPSHLVSSQAALSDVRVRRTAIGAAIRMRHGIPISAPLVITLGGNQQGKGIDVLARAWPAVMSAMPDARWLLCGLHSDWQSKVVIPLLEAQHLLSSVTLAGELHGMDVFEHLAAADLNLNPSLCESLNMVTVEAAATGTPTISSDGAGIADWILRYDAGLVVPAGESAPLADAILRAFRNRAELARWSSAAQAMSGEFAIEHVAGQLLRLLNAHPAGDLS